MQLNKHGMDCETKPSQSSTAELLVADFQLSSVYNEAHPPIAFLVGSSNHRALIWRQVRSSEVAALGLLCLLLLGEAVKQLLSVNAVPSVGWVRNARSLRGTVTIYEDLGAAAVFKYLHTLIVAFVHAVIPSFLAYWRHWGHRRHRRYHEVITVVNVAFIFELLPKLLAPFLHLFAKIFPLLRIEISWQLAILTEGEIFAEVEGKLLSGPGEHHRSISVEHEAAPAKNVHIVFPCPVSAKCVGDCLYCIPKGLLLDVQGDALVRKVRILHHKTYALFREPVQNLSHGGAVESAADHPIKAAVVGIKRPDLRFAPVFLRPCQLWSCQSADDCEPRHSENNLITRLHQFIPPHYRCNCITPDYFSRAGTSSLCRLPAMSPLETLRQRFYDINALGKAVGLLSWDRQVLMPKGGAVARTEHTGRLARMAHELLTSDETRRMIEDAAADTGGDPEAEALIRVIRREIDTSGKLPTHLVERKSRASSDAYEAWKEAKSTNRFSILEPFLEELFEIARETAELRGYSNHVYDALIDLFEEGATYASASRMFGEIKEPIQKMVSAICERGQTPDEFLHGDWDQQTLGEFAQEVASVIGFDFDRGRLDIASNAFCSNFSHADIRLTARSSTHMGGILFSSLHEMGHGLYEQGSPPQWDRTPLAGGISLALHESQSRTWENIAGRSAGLWLHFFPRLQQRFPKLAPYSADDFYRGINRVSPGPIRIGSDELTYNLHILIRFELECEIVTGQLRIRDLPQAWNAKYQAYLGITPESDSEGCLQDVHWSRGSVGYFPTYSMGNMISWQIWRSLQSDVGDTHALMAAGEFMPILSWLQDKVYGQAKLYPPHELVMRVTGRSMETSDYLEAMIEKYGLSDSVK
jgi:carboxypeptidase Taq